MEIIAKEIPLFDNISQYRFGDTFYDFHNDFSFISLELNQESLVLTFNKISSKEMVKIVFKNAVVNDSMPFDYFKNKHLTLDNLYRGRYEKNDKVIEFDGEGRSYFYLEFYEGPKMTFWSDQIYLIN